MEKRSCTSSVTAIVRTRECRRGGLHVVPDGTGENRYVGDMVGLELGDEFVLLHAEQWSAFLLLCLYKSALLFPKSVQHCTCIFHGTL